MRCFKPSIYKTRKNLLLIFLFYESEFYHSSSEERQSLNHVLLTSKCDVKLSDKWPLASCFENSVCSDNFIDNYHLVKYSKLNHSVKIANISYVRIKTSQANVNLTIQSRSCDQISFKFFCFCLLVLISPKHFFSNIC